MWQNAWWRVHRMSCTIFAISFKLFQDKILKKYFHSFMGGLLFFTSYRLSLWVLSCFYGYSLSTDAFELWRWRDSWESLGLQGDQSWVFIGMTDVEAEIQYFAHLMWRTDSFEKTLMLGKIEGGRRGRQRMRCWMASPTQWMWVWVIYRSWWWMQKPGVQQSVGLQRVGYDWATELKLLSSIPLSGLQFWTSSA